MDTGHSGAGRSAEADGLPRQARSQYHAGLSRDAVVASALDLLRRRGAAGFSLRRLAAELGVDTMALYKHVRNKDDLLGAVLARALQAARPSGDGPWWEQLGDLFREHRRVVVAEPWVQTVLLGHLTSSAEPWSGVEEALVLLEPHLGAAGAARWVRWLAAYTNGFLLTEPDVQGGGPVNDAFGEHHRVGAAAARNAAHGDDDFEAGLAILLAAMREEAGGR